VGAGVVAGAGALTIDGAELAAEGKRRMARGRLPFGSVEGASLVTDPSAIPVVRGESPHLARRVREGELPPVHERVGLDPLVIRPLRSIGTYGGTLLRPFNGNSDYESANRFLSGPDRLLYWDHTFTSVTPWIARL
jgi:peptide/nickel transport system substrate-binding protein